MTNMQNFSRMQRRGLYDPRFEHDACGIGFVAQLSGAASHDILSMALTAVGNMAHRGGVGADGKSGDGAGVLTQIPRLFFARELVQLGISYPVEDLAIGMIFLPRDEAQRTIARGLVAQGLASCGLTLLGWLLYLVTLLSHDRLQGPAGRAAVARVLRRPARPGLRNSDRGLPSALFHQHIPDMGARPALQNALAQWRDQHAPG